MNLHTTFAQICAIEMTLRASEALLQSAMEATAELDFTRADEIGAAIEHSAAARAWLRTWREGITESILAGKV